MSTLWARIRWADVAVGLGAWILFAVQYVVLEQLFPETPQGCVETSPFSCWDLRAPLIALLSVPFWYAAWALALRPCPWQLRWLTPLVVSGSAIRLASTVGWDGRSQTIVFVATSLVVAAAMSAANATAAASRP